MKIYHAIIVILILKSNKYQILVYLIGEFFGSIHDRYGHFTKFSDGVCCFTVGHWKNDLMEGVLDMELPSGGWTRASYSKGLKHGLERKFDGPYPKVQCLQRIAFYDNDSIIQVVECLMGGAYLIGRADPEMEKINDKDAIYVYPDLHTAIHGRYVDDQLISGEMCSIEDVEINPETFMLSLKG